MNPLAEKVLVRMVKGDAEESIRTASRIKTQVGGFVVGADFLLDRGPILVGALCAFGKPVLADLGILDRPRVVRRAVARMGKLGARWVSVSGLSGRKGMKAAVMEAGGYSEMSVVVSAMQAAWAGDEDLKGVGISDTPGSQVSRLTRLAEWAGAGGILFPARELGVVVQVSGKEGSGKTGMPGALTRIAEASGGVPRSQIAAVIRGGAHWVVVTPEQVDELETGEKTLALP